MIGQQDTYEYGGWHRDMICDKYSFCVRDTLKHDRCLRDTYVLVGGLGTLLGL